MRIYEFVDEGLGHSSYVIDLGDGTAAVFDPPRFPISHAALVERFQFTNGTSWHPRAIGVARLNPACRARPLTMSKPRSG